MQGTGWLTFSDKYISYRKIVIWELKGDKKGVWSVTVQANWRITFRFYEGDAEIVNYEDYH